MYSPEYYGNEVVDKLTAHKLLDILTEEEREILRLWLFDELTFEEIGKVIGIKYRGRELTGSVIRYHRDQMFKKMRAAYEKDQG